MSPSGTLTNRLGAFAVIPDVLRTLGFDPAAIYAAAGLELSAFAEPETLVPIADLTRLAGVALRASNRRDFGLLVADRARAERIGLLGDLFFDADDLRSGLHTIIRLFHLTTRGAVAKLTVDGGLAELRLALTGPYEDASAAFEDGVVGILFHAMSRFLGPAWRPCEVLLSHAAHAEEKIYRRFFRAPVRFNAMCAAIIFPADDLRRPMIARLTERRRLEAAAAVATSKLGISFDEQVRWLINGRLGEANVTVEAIAAELGLSRRTLNRRLADRGLTFAGLLRGVRFATARRLLVESDAAIAEIAAAVGYGDSGTFSNAFRLWSSHAPGAWRRLHGRV